MSDRVCVKCGESKPLDAFYQRPGRPDFRCKACARALSRRWNAANAERKSRRNKDYRASHKDEARAYGAKWREQNRERVEGAARDYYSRHAAESRERVRQWEKENPQPKRARRAAKQAATLETNTRRGHIWAGWELELVSDYSRTAANLAVQLGRTYHAVCRARNLIRNDPQTIRRAGLSDSGNL